MPCPPAPARSGLGAGAGGGAARFAIKAAALLLSRFEEARALRALRAGLPRRRRPPNFARGSALPWNSPPHLTRSPHTRTCTRTRTHARRQVLYLDADDIPLADPAALFDSPQYAAAGALLWQDFWPTRWRRRRGAARAAAAGHAAGRGHGVPHAGRAGPGGGRAGARRARARTRMRTPLAGARPRQAEAMLGVPRASWPAGSFESGQVALHKRRHWRGLLLAVWLNTHAHFWRAPRARAGRRRGARGAALRSARARACRP